MGFATLIEGDDFCMIFEPSSKLAIGVTNQQGQATGPSMSVRPAWTTSPGR